MANFIELHESNSGEPIFVNMELIEVARENSVGNTVLTGIKHWCGYEVKESVNEIIRKMEEVDEKNIIQRQTKG